MPDAQTVSGGSSPSSQNPPAVTTDWEAKSRELERQLQGLSSERNRYKQQNEAWMRLANDPRAAGAIKFDQATGLPVDWDLTVETPKFQPQYAPVVNPLGDLGVDGNQLNTWLQQNVQSIIQQQGYITQAQADQLATQKAQTAAAGAYQFAEQRALARDGISEYLGQEKQSQLRDLNSDWSKRTLDVLRQNGIQIPENIRSWRDVPLTSALTFEQASKIARSDLMDSVAAANASQQQAIQNQGAAGLAGAFPGASAPAGSPLDQFDKVAAAGGDPLDVLKDLVNRTVPLPG